MIVTANTRLNICPHCNHKNRLGALICENCGRIILKNTFGSTRKVNQEQQPAPQASAIASVGTQHLKPSAAVVMRIADAPTPIKFDPKSPLVLGRINTHNPRRPDIDLTAYHAFEKGVSTRHATIQREDDRLMIADMGSTNGTFVNGDRLNPHEPRVLRDGDEVRLGNLFVHILFGGAA